MKFVTSDYVMDRHGPHHVGKFRISVLISERVPMVVKLSPRAYFFYLYVLCSCSPAQVALYAIGKSLMAQSTCFHAR